MYYLNIWLRIFKIYLDKRIAVIFLIGFSCGLPLLLTGSTLLIWLKEKGVSYNEIGIVALAAFPYTFKFLWAPLIDNLALPFLTSWLGRRRAWLLLSQMMLMVMIFSLASIEPEKNLKLTVAFACLISVAAATQEIVMLAYQVERLRNSQYAAGEAVGIFGYRMGILAAGAGALYLSEFLSWNYVYMIMGTTLSVGVITTLACKEPVPPSSKELQETEKNIKKYLYQKNFFKTKHIPFISHIHTAVICPFQFFMRIPHWGLVLSIMFFYKLGDNLIGNWHNLFYLDLGFSKADIANASKIFGMWMSIGGGFIGGIFIMRWGMMKSLFYLGLFHGIGMCGYLILSYFGHNIFILYATIALENLTGGMRITALFAYQMTLCQPAFAATQLALLTSVVQMGHLSLLSISGHFIEIIGWNNFFSLALVSNVVPLSLVYWLAYLKKESLFKFYFKKSRSPF